MAGLWEGLPASPCSAASDELPSRNMKQPPTYANAQAVSRPTQAISPVSDVHFALPKRHISAADNSDNSFADPPAPKRSRSIPMESCDAMNIDTSSPRTPTVGFAEARDTNTEANSDFVARLNISAADERRKMLLQRLRDIDAKKAQLSAKTGNSESSSPVSAQKADVIVIDDSSSRSDVQEVSSTKPPVRSRNTRKRASRPTKRKGNAKAKVLVPASPDIIDVDAESSSTTKSAKRGSTKSKSQSSSANSVGITPKRVSSRVRRPRLPDGDAASSGDLKPVPTPVCMSKCKRFQFCKKLITSMLRSSSAGPFSAPVSQLWAPEAIPRYFDVITRPMDLGTVKKNMETSTYVAPVQGDLLPYRFDVEKFSDDVRQVFRNSMVYNRAGDMLYNCAKAMMEEFDNTMNTQLPAAPTPEEIVATLAKKRPAGRRGRKEKTAIPYTSTIAGDLVKQASSSDAPVVPNIASATAKTSKKDSWTAAVTKKAESPDPSEGFYESEGEIRDRLKYLRNCRPAVLARRPVPKGEGYLSRAALLYDVEISYQQKVRCSNVIEQGKVPASKLEGLVDLVRKATGDTSSTAEDEFEFELDKLDNKGWRNIEAFLEQYVPGFKTIRSSCLGREFASVSDMDEEIRTLQKKLSDLTAAQKKAKKTSEPVASKPKSFFEDGLADESSSDESDGESDSDESDSESEAE